MVEMWDGWNSLSVNLHNKHVFPTPESPRSRSRKSTSYCLAMVLDVVLDWRSSSQLTQRWMTDLCPPASHVCSNGQWGFSYGSFCSLTLGRWVTKQGCSSFPGSLQLPVGAVDHRQVRLDEKTRLPGGLFKIKVVGTWEDVDFCSAEVTIVCRCFCSTSDIAWLFCFFKSQLPW